MNTVNTQANSHSTPHALLSRFLLLVCVAVAYATSLYADNGSGDWNPQPPQWAQAIMADKDLTDGWKNYTEAPPCIGKERDDVNNTDVDVYEISKPEHLAWVVFKGKTNCNHFILKNDIDLGAHPWITFNTSSPQLAKPFTGLFDGKGFTIRNLYNPYQTTVQAGNDDKETNAALFPEAKDAARFHNVILENVYLIGPKGGALVGYAHDIVRPNKPDDDKTISDAARRGRRFLYNIIVRNALVAGYDNDGLEPVGGIVGRLSTYISGSKRTTMMVENVNFYGEVVVNRNCCDVMGGLVGYVEGSAWTTDNDVEFYNCVSLVDFVTRASSSTTDWNPSYGGYVGYSDHMDRLAFVNCFVLANNKEDEFGRDKRYIGKLVGQLENDDNYRGSGYGPKNGENVIGSNSKYNDQSFYSLDKSYRKDGVPRETVLDFVYKYKTSTDPFKYLDNKFVSFTPKGADVLKFTTNSAYMDTLVYSDSFDGELETLSVPKQSEDILVTEYLLLPHMQKKGMAAKGIWYNYSQIAKDLSNSGATVASDDDWQKMSHGIDVMVKVLPNGNNTFIFNPENISIPVASGLRGYSVTLDQSYVLYWTNAKSQPDSKTGAWHVYRNDTLVAKLEHDVMEWRDTEVFRGVQDKYVAVTYKVGWVDESINLTGDYAHFETADLNLPVPRYNLTATDTKDGVRVALPLPCDNWYKGSNVQFYRSTKGIDSKVKIGEQQEFTFTESEAKNKVIKEVYVYDNSFRDRCEEYIYWGDIIFSNSIYETIDSTSYHVSVGDSLLNLTATCGAFNDRVRLKWDMKYESAQLKYDIQRRRVDMAAEAESGEWTTVYTVIDNKPTITYDDMVMPGYVYQYRLAIHAPCNGEFVESDPVLTKPLEMVRYGYANSMGSIAGRITYKSSNGVSDIATQDVDLFVTVDETDDVSYAMTHNAFNTDGKQYITANVAKLSSLWSGNWTVQCHVAPEFSIDPAAQATVFTLPSRLALVLKPESSGNLGICLKDPQGNVTPTSLSLAPNSPIRFRHIVVTGSKNSVRVGCMDHHYNESDTLLWSEPITITPAKDASATLCLLSDNGTDNFAGSIDEVRIWNKCLTTDQVMKNYNRYITGTEEGLMLYYTFDEAVTNVVFDHQHRNNEWSDHKGEVVNQDPFTQPKLERIIDYKPFADKALQVAQQTSLAARGITNAQGEYQIVGIPFAGTGTQYSIEPHKGTHVFNPAVVQRVLSNDTKTYNNLNFVDESSFDVSLQAYYALGNLPAEGLQVLVDGAPVTNKRGNVKTDVDGSARINVPIGKHTISLKAVNHTMLNPMEGEPDTGLPCLNRHIDEYGNVKVTPLTADGIIDFQADIDRPLVFYDNTYMRLAGRVVGGEREANRQFAYTDTDSLSLRASRNNIGEAQLVLRASGNQFEGRHVLYTDDSDIDELYKSTDSVYCSNPYGVIGNIDSKTIYRRGQEVTVTTDPKTGEYLALLPPVKWEILSAKSMLIHARAEEQSLAKEIAQMGINTFTVDMAQDMQSDSIQLDNRLLHKAGITAEDDHPVAVFPYHIKKNLTRYAADADVMVLDYYRSLTANNLEKAKMLGEELMQVTTTTYEQDPDDPQQPLVKKTEEHDLRFINDNGYAIGLPVFRQGDPYALAIGIFEKYNNYDSGVCVVDTVPLAAADIDIYNGWAASSVTMDEAWVDTTRVQRMTREQLQNFTYTVNDTTKVYGKTGAGGFAFSYFTAGVPKAAAPYTSNFYLTYNHHGKTVMWPDKPMQGVVLGSMHIPGSTFVTKGPDAVDFVLNDPPGATSSAYIDKGSSITLNYSLASDLGEVNSSEGSMVLGTKVNQSAGGVVASQVVVDTDVSSGLIGKQDEYEVYADAINKQLTYKFNENFSTSSSADFVGADGDVYFGRSTNVFIADARHTNIARDGEHIAPADVAYSIYSEPKDGKPSVKFNIGSWIQPIAGSETATTFAYTQHHILNILIPELRKRRNALIENRPEYYDRHAADFQPNTTDECTYYAKRWPLPDDADSLVADLDYICIPSVNGKVRDLVSDYSTFIKVWKKAVEDHEHDKAFNFEELSKGETYVENISIKNVDLNDIADNLTDEQINTIITAGFTPWSKVERALLSSVELAFAVYKACHLANNWLNISSILTDALEEAFKVVWHSIYESNRENADETYKQKLHFDLNESYDVGAPLSKSLTVTSNFSQSSAYNDGMTYMFGDRSKISTSIFSIKTESNTKGLIGIKQTGSVNTSKAFAGTTTYGYSLGTEGASTFESVDVYLPVSHKATIDKENNVTNNGVMPFMFKLLGGQSKFPYEGPDYTKFYRDSNNKPVAISGGTVSTVEADLEMLEAFHGLPAGEKSSIEATISNISTATYTATATENGPNLEFGVDPRTNDNGLLFNFNNHNSRYVINLKPGEKSKISFTVEQTRTDVVNDTVNFFVRPEGDTKREQSKRVVFSFVPKSSPVNLALDKVTVNQSNRTLTVSLSGYHREYKNFAGVIVQTRPVGQTEWNNRYLVYNDESKYNLADWTDHGTPICKPMLDGTTTVALDLSTDTDGDYEIRALCQTKTAAIDPNAIENACEPQTYTLDTHAPRVMNTPKNTLYYGENISLKFNEDIRHQSVRPDNFVITADIDEQASKYHSVAMSFNQTAPAQTEHQLNLIGGRDFTLGMWFKPQDKGKTTLFAQNIIDSQYFTIGYDSSTGKLLLNDGTTLYESQPQPQHDEWMYLLVNYAHGADMDNFQLTLYNENSATEGTLHVTTNNTVNAPQSPVYIGATPGKTDGNASIHNVVLWDGIVTKSFIDDNLQFAIDGVNTDMIALWTADEGRGTIVNEQVYARNLKLPDAQCWYSRMPNYSLRCTDDQTFTIKADTISVLKPTSSYALSFWFKPLRGAQTATLFESPGDDNFAIALTGGRLAFAAGTTTIDLADISTNVWHSFFMEYVAGGNTRFYVDGELCRETETDKIPLLKPGTLTVSRGFDGLIDDIKLQQGRFTPEAIESSLQKCLTGTEDGLLLYFPFQEVYDNDLALAYECRYNYVLNPSTRILINAVPMVGSGSAVNLDKYDSPLQLAATVRRILSAPNEYNITASEREVQLSLDEDFAKRLSDKRLHITARDITDMHGNPMQEPYSWDVLVNQDVMAIYPKLVEYTVPVDTVFYHYAYIVKNKPVGKIELTNGLQDYNWLTVENVTDEDDYYSASYRINTAELSPGVYYAHLKYVSKSAQAVTQTVKITVRGKDPGWSVDASLYATNMSIVADLYLGERLWVDPNVKVAAFIEGKCQGVGLLKYNEPANRSVLYLTIHGNEMQGGKPVSLKAFDPSTGITYSLLELTDETGNAKTLYYFADKLYGSYLQPWHIKAYNNVQQDIALAPGWNWIGTTITPADTQLATILEPVKQNILAVKARTTSSAPDSKGEWKNIDKIAIEPAQMYMVNVSRDNPVEYLSIDGKNHDASDIEITIAALPTRMAWSWIGYPCHQARSLKDALSFLTPNAGDIIKSQKDFAIFDGHAWHGTLTTLMPGQGYMYGNAGNTAMTFHFPADDNTAANNLSVADDDDNEPSANSQMVCTDYPYNMVLVGKTIPGATVQAFVAGEQRASATADGDGRVFLNIQGEGEGQNMTFLIVDEEQKAHRAAQHTDYADNKVAGSVDSPMLITPEAANANDDVYDTQGHRWGKFSDIRHLPQGIYIIGGVKFRVK